MTVLDTHKAELFRELTEEFLKWQSEAHTFPVVRLWARCAPMGQKTLLVEGVYGISLDGKHYWIKDLRGGFWRRFRADTISEEDASMIGILIDPAT